MSADKTVHEEINEFRERWREIWWRMADGDIVGYREIKKLPVLEFWGFFDKWQERNKQKLEHLQRQKNRN